MLVTSIEAKAVPATFNFSGIVTSVHPDLVGEFSVSESIVGSYTFETTTPDSDPGDITTGIYDNAITAFTATFGGDYTVIEGSDNDINVADGTPGNDSYNVFLTNPTAPTVAGLSVGALFLGLIDTDSTVFTSDALPATLPNLSEFEDTTSGVLFLDPPTNKFVNFELTSLSLVPEPSTCALAIFGLLGAVNRRKKRA